MRQLHLQLFREDLWPQLRMPPQQPAECLFGELAADMTLQPLAAAALGLPQQAPGQSQTIIADELLPIVDALRGEPHAGHAL